MKLYNYYPIIKVNTKDILIFKIKNYNNIKEVKENVYDYFKERYISNDGKIKPITNISTGMKIEIWKSGISETFGNSDYYKNLSIELKKIKLATMMNLAKMIKYGKIRSISKPNQHNINSKAVYFYLEHPIIIDNVEYIVNIDIRCIPNTNGRFYIHSVKTKKEAINASSCSYSH